MRLGLGAHTHFARRLHAEKAGQADLVEHLGPGAVGQNHHFAHQGIDGRAALARGPRKPGRLKPIQCCNHLARRAQAQCLPRAFLAGDGQLVKRDQIADDGRSRAAPSASSPLWALKCGCDGLNRRFSTMFTASILHPGALSVEIGIHIDRNKCSRRGGSRRRRG